MRKKSIFSRAYEGTKVKESDLNVIVTEFNCVIQDEVQKEKEEFFNLKTRNVNKKNFMEYTYRTNMLSSIFDKGEDKNISTENSYRNSMVV